MKNLYISVVALLFITLGFFLFVKLRSKYVIHEPGLRKVVASGGLDKATALSIQNHDPAMIGILEANVASLENNLDKKSIGTVFFLPAIICELTLDKVNTTRVRSDADRYVISQNGLTQQAGFTLLSKFGETTDIKYLTRSYSDKQNRKLAMRTIETIQKRNSASGI